MSPCLPLMLQVCNTCIDVCRWNAVEHGSAAVHLELLPMLLGFFTYKAGVVGRGAFELLSNSAGSSNSSSTSEDSATQAAGGPLIYWSCCQRLSHIPGESRRLS